MHTYCDTHRYRMLLVCHTLTHTLLHTYDMPANARMRESKTQRERARQTREGMQYVICRSFRRCLHCFCELMCCIVSFAIRHVIRDCIAIAMSYGKYRYCNVIWQITGCLTIMTGCLAVTRHMTCTWTRAFRILCVYFVLYVLYPVI